MSLAQVPRQLDLDSVHVHYEFRLQESDDEIPPPRKSRRNPRMMTLHTPSRSLLDCPLNLSIRIAPARRNDRKSLWDYLFCVIFVSTTVVSRLISPGGSLAGGLKVSCFLPESFGMPPYGTVDAPELL